MAYYKRKMTKGKPKSKPKRTSIRRRLQPSIGGAIIGAAVAGGKRMYNRRVNAKNYAQRQAKSSLINNLQNTDNIVKAKAVVIGTPKKDSFQEKISKAIRAPLLFKRQFGFNAESSVSGRKAMFSMGINLMNSGDLQQDISTYKNSYTTDTAAIDDQISPNAESDGAYYYVESHREKIRMINSSTLPLTGKVYLFAHKRDTGNTYGNSGAIIDPVNMLMYYSASAPIPVVADVGGGTIVGRGFEFNNTAPDVTNYAVSHASPGASSNSSGVCAIMDPSLSFTSQHVKDGINFWFRKVSSQDLSLKPGQEINLSYVFNDLPNVNREEQAQYVHIAGVTYHVVVEFQGGVVGDSTPTTGDGIVTIGCTQLSVYRESTRRIGLKNTLRSKILLQSIPIANVSAATQVTINPDSGDVDIGVAFDT